MPIEILMPALSPTMTEGNLTKWLKQEGDKISPGEVIAEIETDKATMEVEAADSGILGKIVVPSGTENVAVNQLIALILEEDEDPALLNNYATSTPQVSAKAEIQNIEIVTKRNEPTQKDNRLFASPLARRIALNENIDLKQIKGTGPHGRIVKADLGQAKGEAKANKTMASAANYLCIGRSEEEYKKIPNSNMRKIIAKRLCESKQTVPHFYLSIECEIDKLTELRANMNLATDKDNPAYKLSVNDFVIKAVAMALRKVPAANASWTDEAILQFNNVDVSVAVAIDGGLITPIIRNADQKSMAVISNEMKDLAIRARAGKLAPQEFQGGGFSISNLGMYGIKKFNAIVNPPQSCILAIGAGSERAIVKNSKIEIANIMDVSLSCDHRVVDGAVGAEFLSAFKKYIENPVTMLV
jgi:pyruvate dehydrogenase E2 component (dihydrolipoamide acetyltransferase)